MSSTQWIAGALIATNLILSFADSVLIARNQSLLLLLGQANAEAAPAGRPCLTIVARPGR